MRKNIQSQNTPEKIYGSIFGVVVFAVLMVLGFHFSVSAKELRNLVSADEIKVIYENQYEIPKEYQFSAQIQRDKTGKILTEFEPFGTWDNKEKKQADISEEAVVSRIADESKKGRIGAWYYNVGSYHGKTVDLKCTIVDYKQMELADQSNKTEMDNNHYGWIGLSEEHLGIYQSNLEWAELLMEFFDGSTGEPLPVKSTAVMTDVDNGEGMMVVSEYQSLMINENCTLEKISIDGKILFTGSKGQNAIEEDEDDWAQIQVLFENSEFRYRMYAGDSEGVTFQYQGYSDCRLAPLEVNKGEMSVSDADEHSVEACTLAHREEEFSYEMLYEVPLEHKKWYYDSFIVTSQLPEQLELCTGSVYTEQGKNVTSQFYLREKNGLVTFEAKQKKNRNFYGKTYIFQFHVKVKADTSIDSLWDGRFYSLRPHSQIEIQQGTRKEVWTSKDASARIDAEYVAGQVFISLKDALSGASLADGEVILLEWNAKKKAYYETERIPYSKERSGYYCEGLRKTHDNQGKYKILESKVPEHYAGSWEQEIQLTKNQESFSFEAEHQPLGENKIHMTSILLTGDGRYSEETGSLETAVDVKRGEQIQYHIYVERDSAPSYKSGELILTSKIPKGAVYEKETLNLIGEIQHPVENSKAKIASVRLSKDGVLTWKINHLDDGEIAHVLFEISVPEQDTEFTNYAELEEHGQKIQSNILKHQLKVPKLDLSMQSLPEADVAMKTGEKITYELIAENTGTGAAKNVIVRHLIPTGTTYMEHSLSCERKDAEIHLARTSSEENSPCKMIYAVIPHMEPGERVAVRLQVQLDYEYGGDEVAAYGEIQEVWQVGADVSKIALEKDGYIKSDSLVHKVRADVDEEISKEETKDESDKKTDENKSEKKEDHPDQDESKEESKEELKEESKGDVNEDSKENAEDGVIPPDEIKQEDNNKLPEEHEADSEMKEDSESDQTTGKKESEKVSGGENAAKTVDQTQVGVYFWMGTLAILLILLCFLQFKRSIK